MPRPNEPAIATQAIEQMRDLAVMFCNLLHCLLRLPTEPTSRAVVPGAREVFWPQVPSRLPCGLRTGQASAGIERAVVGSKPFGAKCCAAAAAIVDRQLQGPEQTLN